MDTEHTEPGQDSPRVTLKEDSLLDRLVSAGLWGAGVGWLASMMGVQIALHRLTDPRNIQWVERLYTRGQVALTGSRWKAVVDPAVDPQRPYFFFQNHVNHLDHCTMYCATPHFKQGVELERHFSYPIYGTFMRGRGTIAVNNESPKQMREMIKRMRAEYREGKSLLVFPEGTRTMTGELGEFQAGVFRIAHQMGAAIVPVTVTGMYRVMRKGSLLIRPGYDVTVYCDAPVETRDYGKKQMPELMDRVRGVMQTRLDDYWRNSSPEPSLGPADGGNRGW